MELTEAVRIVREQTIPALRGSGGGGHAAALETVLAALEQVAKPCTHMEAHVSKLEAALAEVQAQLRQAEVLGDQAEQELEQAQREAETLTDKLSSVTEDYIKHRNALERAERERDEARTEVERLDRLNKYNVAEGRRLEAEVERLRAALAVGVEAIVNLCTHLYLSPVEAHWPPRHDLRRMRAALAPEVK